MRPWSPRNELHSAAPIRRHDPAFHHPFKKVHADWLGTPFSAHCRDYMSHEFSLQLVTQCLIPGSYALHAVATVKSALRADRQFSLFRVGRYDPDHLTLCLSDLGWEELGAMLYGDDHSLRLYRKQSRVYGPTQARPTS